MKYEIRYGFYGVRCSNMNIDQDGAREVWRRTDAGFSPTGRYCIDDGGVMHVELEGFRKTRWPSSCERSVGTLWIHEEFIDFFEVYSCK